MTQVTSGTEALTAEELDAFDAGWGDGDKVEDKVVDEASGKLIPAKIANRDDEAEVTEEAEDDESEATSEEEADEATDDEETTEEDESTTDSEEEDSAGGDEEDGEGDKAQDKKTTLTPEEQKAHNDEMAKARIAERKARESARQAEVQHQEATIERYIADAGEDEAEKSRRQLNVDAWRVKEEKIGLNQERLDTGIQRALAEVPMLTKGSDAAKEELASSLDDFEARFVVKDAKGRPTEIKIDPATGKPADVVAFLQTKSKSIERLMGDGATKQEKSKSKEKSRTTTPPVRAPKKEKTDVQMDAFDKEAARY